MKTQILNLGKALNKAEQKEINGGRLKYCRCDSECGSGQHCCRGACFVISSNHYPVGNCPSLQCPSI